MEHLHLATVETHISRLLFVDDRVIKWFRPLATPFLDHRSLDDRHKGIARELQENRRFAPDVYLDVVSVRGSDGAELEPALLMRRLPDERRLSSRLDAPSAAAEVAQVCRVVAAVHATAPRSAAIDRFGSPEWLHELWVGNLGELRDLGASVIPSETVAEMADRFDRWITGRQEWLGRRVRDGWIVDGHGDLLTDDIFMLDDGPRILDCLAFRDDFRCGDVAADLAFLVMDLHHRGHPELAAVTRHAYGEFAGHPVPASLLAAWVAHRAFVRAKVECLRHLDGDETAVERARRLFALGAEQLRLAEPVVVLVGGAPGTGKSTVAEELGSRLGAAVLQADAIRKELAGLDPLTRRSAPVGEGLYTTAHTAAVYAELIRRAHALVSAGERVVLDASWSSAEHRAELRRSIGADAVIVELRCDAPAGVADERIRRRAEQASDPSDATVEVATWMRQAFTPWPEAAVLDTTPPAAEVADTAWSSVSERLTR